MMLMMIMMMIQCEKLAKKVAVRKSGVELKAKALNKSAFYAFIFCCSQSVPLT